MGPAPEYAETKFCILQLTWKRKEGITSRIAINPRFCRRVAEDESKLGKESGQQGVSILSLFSDSVTAENSVFVLTSSQIKRKFKISFRRMRHVDAYQISS